jgi:hypothetical protein
LTQFIQLLSIYMSITPSFIFFLWCHLALALSVSPIVIVIMNHLVPTPESFEITMYTVQCAYTSWWWSNQSQLIVFFYFFFIETAQCPSDNNSYHVSSSAYARTVRSRIKVFYKEGRTQNPKSKCSFSFRKLHNSHFSNLELESKLKRQNGVSYSLIFLWYF